MTTIVHLELASMNPLVGLQQGHLWPRVSNLGRASESLSFTKYSKSAGI